jgi:predicted  nucleic acid-binding Zn-ribbon protein
MSAKRGDANDELYDDLSIVAASINSEQINLRAINAVASSINNSLNDLQERMTRITERDIDMCNTLNDARSSGSVSSISSASTSISRNSAALSKENLELNTKLKFIDEMLSEIRDQLRSGAKTSRNITSNDFLELLDNKFSGQGINFQRMVTSLDNMEEANAAVERDFGHPSRMLDQLGEAVINSIDEGYKNSVIQINDKIYWVEGVLASSLMLELF